MLRTKHTISYTHNVLVTSFESTALIMKFENDHTEIHKKLLSMKFVEFRALQIYTYKVNIAYLFIFLQCQKKSSAKTQHISVF